MRNMSLFLALALTSCVSNSKSFSDQFCDDFFKWSESGPRENNQALIRKVHFPNSYSCYEAGGADTIVVTCLVIDWACSDNEDCSDKADAIFRSAAYRRAHFWTEFDFFQNIAVCVGARETAAGTFSAEADLPKNYSVIRKGNRFDLQYSPDNRLTKIEITYDVNN